MIWSGSALAGLLLGAPMVCPGGRYEARPAGRVVVLQDGANPSTDFYLREPFADPGLPPADYLDIAMPAAGRLDASVADGAGIFVVICRYVTADWLAELERNRNRLVGVAYFVDDDLPAMLRDRSLPGRYRRKIAQRYGRHVARLSRLADRLWVSTDALARKYAACGATLLPPGPLVERSEPPVRMFYHGTAGHRRESRWLATIMRSLRARGVDATLELFGGADVRRAFRDIPGVIVLHPLAWRDYLAWSAGERRDIGLAPLLPSTVNAARAPTRFFEIARLRAAGIYSDVPPYAGFVRDGEDGLLLPNDTDAWAAAIAMLAGDGDRRRAIARAAETRCRSYDHAPAVFAALAGPLPAAADEPRRARLACAGGGE